MQLIRYSYESTHTRGRLILNDSLTLETIERPWVDNKSFVSCIPDGVYTFERHSSDRHQNTVALVNEALDVYHWDHGHGRSVILIHKANWAHQVQGCIAVGMTASNLYSKGRQAHLPSVSSSGQAMDLLRPHLVHGRTIEIKPTTGTSPPVQKWDSRARGVAA